MQGTNATLVGIRTAGLLQGAGRQTGRTGFQICMSGAEVEWPAAVHAVAARQLR